MVCLLRIQTVTSTVLEPIPEAKIKMKKNIEMYSDVLVCVGETSETRKPAFSRINRGVNLKHVESILGTMKVKGYRESAPIQVLPAEDVSKYGITELLDMNGNLISSELYDLYFFVCEGQHRSCAVSRYNDWLTSQSKESIEIPAIKLRLKVGETLAEYLSEINMTQREWTKEDFLRGAANIDSDNQLLQRYKELIKTESNPTGFSLSTLNLIFCNNSSALNKTDFILLCTGVKTKGKANKDIIPGFDLATGNKFLELCEKSALRKSEIAKRYLITEFNNLRNSNGGSDFALGVFKSITQDDVKQMLNINEHLEEEKVIYQIKVVKERFLASTKEKPKVAEEITEIHDESPVASEELSAA